MYIFVEDIENQNNSKGNNILQWIFVNILKSSSEWEKRIKPRLNQT